VQYASLQSTNLDYTSLQVYHCNDKPTALVVWIHGGGWVSGDRRRTRRMPTFFREHNILFVSANYPLSANAETTLIDLQILALQGLDKWLTENPLKEKYPEAFANIMLLAHSAGSHLVALTDKMHGWNAAVSSLVLMDSGAYDLETRYRHARPQQRRQFARLLGLDSQPRAEHDSMLRSFSPALLDPKPRQGRPLKVIIMTSQRPGAYYAARQLERSYNAPGYKASLVQFCWSHEEFPDAIGVDQQINRLLLSTIASSSDQ